MNAKVFADTSSMSREEWLKYRTMGIGGSDVSVIAGINPYRSVFQLWLEKTGQTEPCESGNECTHFGTVLEPIVKQEFTERTGIEIAEPKFIYQHPDYPFMFANLDGVVNVGGEECIFEAKTASAYKQNEWNTGVPPEYMMQIQHYMAVTGLKKTYIAALIGGNHFVYKTVERDDEMIADIIEMERRFWEENVLGGEEPLPDGSEGTTSWLSEHYSESNGESIELPEETVFICDEYEDISEQIEALSAEKDALGNRLKAMLKNNETALERHWNHASYGQHPDYLYELCNLFGLTVDDISLLYEMGYCDEEIEMMLDDRDYLNMCLEEAKAYYGDCLMEESYGVKV